MKKKVRVWHLVVCLAFVLACFLTKETHDFSRHQEIMQVLKPMSHDVDSIGDHGQYIIEHHFKYCKLTPNEDYEPFYPEID